MFKKSALANMTLSYAPIAVGVLFAILLPGAMRNPNAYFVAAIAFYTVGFVFFAAAKVQNIRKGYLVSFGSAQMSGWQSWAYRLGYIPYGDRYSTDDCAGYYYQDNYPMKEFKA